MSTLSLEDAIEKISLNEDYKNAVYSNPELLLEDFKISEESLVEFKKHGNVVHEIKEVRPTALCCTCVAPA